MASPMQNILVEDAINALVECLVDPSLANINQYAGSSVGEEDIAKQMEAVAWLYNQYLCEEAPNLKPLDWLGVRNKAVVIRPNLMRFMSMAKTSNPTLTLTEMKIKNACAMTEALKSLNNSRENFPVSKVSVCLLNARRDKFVLVFGKITGGVWSFIEKSKEIDVSSKPNDEVSHSGHSEEKLALMAVQEQTGIKTSLLQIEDSFLVNDCMNQDGGGTKFYIFSCHGTFDLSPAIKLKKIVWVSVNAALSSTDGHFLEKTPLGVRSTSAVQYFHLRPFRYLIRNWFMRQFKLRNLEMSTDKSANIARDEKSVHTKSSGLPAANGLSMSEAGRHLDDKLASKTMNVMSGNKNLSRQETHEINGHSKSDAGMVSENAFQCHKNNGTLYQSEHSAKVAEFDESSMLQCQVTVGEEPPKESDGVGRAMCPYNSQSVNLEESKQQKTDIVIPEGEVPHEPKDKSACTPRPDELFHINAKLSNQKINATNLHLDLCEQNPSPESLTQMRRKQEEYVVYDGAGSSTQQAALRVLNEGRKVFSKELVDITAEYQARINHLNKQIAECDANLTTLLEGGKAAAQLALELCKNSCQKQQIDTMTPDDHKRGIPVISTEQRETSGKKRCLSRDPFQMPRSSMQELTEICMKNSWPLPSYGVFTIKNHQKQNLFSGKVRVRGSNFELSESGELCDSVKAAKASAAACMLSALYLVRSRGSIL